MFAILKQLFSHDIEKNFFFKISLQITKNLKKTEAMAEILRA